MWLYNINYSSYIEVYSVVYRNIFQTMHYTDTITLMKKNIFFKFFVKATF